MTSAAAAVAKSNKGSRREATFLPNLARVRGGINKKEEKSLSSLEGRKGDTKGNAKSSSLSLLASNRGGRHERCPNSRGRCQENASLGQSCKEQAAKSV